MRHVWTNDFGEKVTRHFFGSYRQCRKYIVARWGHWPCWATISRSTDSDRVKQWFGIR